MRGSCGAAKGLWGLHGGFLEGGFMMGFVVASGGASWWHLWGLHGGFVASS